MSVKSTTKPVSRHSRKATSLARHLLMLPLALNIASYTHDRFNIHAAFRRLLFELSVLCICVYF